MSLRTVKVWLLPSSNWTARPVAARVMKRLVSFEARVRTHQTCAQVAQLREEIAGVSALMDDAQAQNEMIADAVTRATEISEQNAAAAEETAAATEQQLASLESVAASVRELSTLGARMFELLQADSVQPADEPSRERGVVDLSRPVAG